MDDKLQIVFVVMQVGGMEEAYIAAKPLFSSMGKNTIYCGGNGNGAVSLLLLYFSCEVLLLSVSSVGTE